MIAQTLRAARSAARRIRSDGRLPADSRRLAIDGVRVLVADVAAGPVSAVLPVVGRRFGPAQNVARHGWRRWSTATGVAVSAHELQHQLAGAVVAALENGGVRPFVTSASGGHVELGLEAADSRRAWDALTTLEPVGTWYVDWTRGHRRSTVLTTARWRRGPVLRSATWRVFQLRRDADGHLVGRDAGPLITFWTPGPRARLERVGVRGLARFSADSPPTTEVVDGHPYPSRAAFAAGRALSRHTDPVDVVVTWVDGDDPVWQTARAQWAGDVAHTTEDATDAARFRSFDELRYALRSVASNAGWVRRIFVVTAGQRPAWLVEDDRLRVVSHEEIFPADWLPTFNSHSIESRLHHIEGLADHFVYMNDDMFFARPVDPGTFFTSNGLPLFFLGDGRVEPVDVQPDLGVDAAARNGRRLIERTWGRVVEHKLLHAPYAHRRDVLLDAERMFAEDFARTGQSRFRANTDLSVASSFGQYVGFCTGRSLPGHIECKYVDIENAKLSHHLRQIRTRRFDTFCLNATAEAMGDHRELGRVVADFLEGYFPTSSPWERPAGG